MSRKRTERERERQRQFGRRMQRLRDEQGLTQGDVTRMSGLDRSFISNLETGVYSIASARLSDLAQGLRIDTVDLFEEEHAVRNKDEVGSAPRYMELVDFISKEIASGLLRPGDFLPREVAMCQRYGYSSFAIRKALAILRGRGLIRSRGEHHFVASPDDLQPIEIGDGDRIVVRMPTPTEMFRYAIPKGVPVLVAAVEARQPQQTKSIQPIASTFMAEGTSSPDSNGPAIRRIAPGHLLRGLLLDRWRTMPHLSPTGRTSSEPQCTIPPRWARIRSIMAETPNDLFTPMVPNGKLDRMFRDTALHPGHEAARELIDAIFANFRDVDRSFIRELQPAGFSARVFELALFAYIEEQNLDLDRTAIAPDFVLRGQNPVAIEVTTTNPVQGTPPDDSARRSMVPSNLPAADREFVFQMGKALRRKLQHRDADGHAYWEKPHVKDIPFVIAVGAFHNEHAQFHPDGLLATYLYGLDQTLSHDDAGNPVVTQHEITEHQLGDKTIPSGLFRQPEAANLSGVLFSNSHTIAKFNRIGTELGMGHPETALVRFGTCYNHDPNAVEADQFVYIVDEQPDDLETFAEGLHLFINPWATKPLSPVALPNIVVYLMRDNGALVPNIPVGFLPRVSKTFTLTGKGAQLAAKGFQQDYIASVSAVLEERRQAPDGDNT